MRIRILILLGTMLCCSIAPAQPPQATIQKITDIRAHRSADRGLTIELAFTGDELDAARGMRGLRVARAVDSTGRNLLEKADRDLIHPYYYQELWSGSEKMHLSLLNPNRQASEIKELTGEALFHFPQRDPGSVITIAPLSKRVGEQIPELSRKGVKLLVLDHATVEQIKANNRHTQSGSSVPPAKSGNKEPGDDVSRMLKRLGLTLPIDKGDIHFLLEDPKSIVVDMEVRDGKGQKMKELRTLRPPLSNIHRYTLRFAQPLPPDAQLIVYLATPKSITSVPLKFTGIVLP